MSTPEFDIKPDNEPERPDVRDVLDETNVMHDVVRHSRSLQVLNEEQTALTLLNYITGLLPNKDDFGAAVITGGTASGKTHMKEKVVEKLFKLKWADWAYTTTSTSAKAIIDDEDWDLARFAALDELQKIPKEMLELMKSTYADDSGFSYARNKPDQDAYSGFTPVKMGRDPLPVIFMLADENEFDVDAELGSRFMEIKVDENEEKNASVHDVKWGHSQVSMPNTDVTYYNPAPETTEALQWHIAEIPLDTDVILPTGEGRFEGDDINFAHVAKPIFNFKKNESTRASRVVASLVKASALLNYHARPRVRVDGEEKIVAQAEDLGNLLACRNSLLVTTHGLGDKKMAVLDAIIKKGGQANREGTKLQARREEIEEYLRESADIAQVDKDQVRKILKEMDNDYIIDITENPEDRRENLYVYGGADTLGEPNVWDYIDVFSQVTDPILDQPITESVRQQQESLGKASPKDVLDGAKATKAHEAMGGSESGQTTFEGRDDGSQVELDERAQHVHAALYEAMNDVSVPMDSVDDLEYEHMLGVVDRGEPVTSNDISGTIFDPHSDWWAEGFNRGDVRTEVGDTIARLRSQGLWHMVESGDEITIKVKAP